MMSEKIKICLLGIYVFFGFLIGLLSCTQPAKQAAGNESVSPGASPPTQTAGSVPDFICRQPPQLQPSLPADSAFLTQADINCFVWQEFIALNWAASTTVPGEPDTGKGAAQFGDPTDGSRIVWQTYKLADDVFLPNAQEPAPWGGGTAPQPSLWMTSKFSATPALDQLNDIFEPGKHTVTAQNGTLVRYEIRMNRDEFEYIRANGLYNAVNQYNAVQPNGPGISLPDGSAQFATYGKVGAIEIKAAWLELTDASLRPRYKTMEAQICPDKTGQNCRTAIVGLVGLHIAHKTSSMPQWVWATFEHVDNAPDKNEVRGNQLKASYAFYNPACDTSRCPPNQTPTPDPPSPSDPPTQVVEMTPLPDEVKSLNQAVQSLIAQQNPDSVWQYYRLVNVIWPQSGVKIPAGAQVPLDQGSATPTLEMGGVANPVLETYVQQTATCFDCHSYAAVAKTKQEAKPQWASDYSFLLSRAQEP